MKFRLGDLWSPFSRRTPPGAPERQEESAGLFNWDDCNPKTNGEEFLIDLCAAQWDLCLDIGANTGEYAAHVLRRNPACQVICFEPNTSLHGALREKGVSSIVPAAVGDRAGSVAINFNGEDPSQSSIHRNNDRCESRVVPVVTLDGYLAEHGIRHVPFVKVDTEGHEIAVLRGASKALREQRIGMLQFEYGGTYLDARTSLRQAYELLQGNYLVCHLFPRGWVPMPYGEELETYRYSNWIAVARNLFQRGGTEHFG